MDQAEDDEATLKFLRDVIVSFIIAGRDTTASTLAWTFYELKRHPEVEAKLIAEVKEHFGEDDFDDSKLTYDYLLRDLPYLRGVLFEALRLHPPVPQVQIPCPLHFTSSAVLLTSS